MIILKYSQDNSANSTNSNPNSYKAMSKSALRSENEIRNFSMKINFTKMSIDSTRYLKMAIRI